MHLQIWRELHADGHVSNRETSRRQMLPVKRLCAARSIYAPETLFDALCLQAVTSLALIHTMRSGSHLNQTKFLWKDGVPGYGSAHR